MGPFLFLIYINGLINYKIVGKVICFADDTLVLKEDTNLDILINLVSIVKKHGYTIIFEVK